MQRGVYIVANDWVLDNAIALLSSLRMHDPDLPVLLIPFDDCYQRTYDLLHRYYQVQLFPDLGFLDEFTRTIAEIFPTDFLKRPNKMRKLAVWFGPLDEFVYVDTDMLLFRSLAETLDYLSAADFVACDFHYAGQGLANVFTDIVLRRGVFTETDVRDTFNSGFWASRRRAFTFEQMFDHLKTCANHPEYFDFSSGTTDQPILNYLMLQLIPRRLNLTRIVLHEPGSWAGSGHFTELARRLYDGKRPLRYLHWAGIPMVPGGAYRDLWEYYRFRTVELPLQATSQLPQPGFRRRLSRYWQRWFGRSHRGPDVMG